MDATRICLDKLASPIAAHLLRKRGQSEDGKQAELRVGDRCPACGRGRIGFDPCLNLACQRCNFALTGGFT